MNILLPIKPEYSQKILNGSKKFEFRTRIAKQPIEKIYIYETSPTMKVVGEVNVLGILEDSIESLWRKTKNFGGICKEAFFNYFGNKQKGYAYKLGSFNKYDEPMNLESFNIDFPPQSYVYIN